MFRDKNDKTAKGPITQGMEVELTWCMNGQPVAVVQPFKGDNTTLLVSEFGASKDLTVSHGSRLEYI